MPTSDLEKPTELKPPFQDEFPEDGIQLGEEAEREYELGTHTISELVGSGIKRALDESTPAAMTLAVAPREASRGRAVRVVRTSRTYDHRRTTGPDDNYVGYHGPVPENER